MRAMLKYIMLGVSLLLVGLDQIFKKLAIDHLMELGGEGKPLIPDVLHLTYVENRGAAFGIMQNMRVLMIVMTLVVIVGFLVYIIMSKRKSPFLYATMSLIIAGGIGNLIDRIFRGFVVDYIDFRLINFAVFNLADCCVVIGAILFAVYIIFIDGKHEKEPVLDENGEVDDSVALAKGVKLSLNVVDNTEVKGEKINKYITVVGQVGTDEEDEDNNHHADDADNHTDQDGEGDNDGGESGGEGGDE